MTGMSLPSALEKKLVTGADEIDLVRSGLEDGMKMAFEEIKNTYDSNDSINDLRTAAYVIAIRKISRTYLDIGVY